MERKIDENESYVIVSGGLYGGHTLVASHTVKIVEEPKRPGEFTIEQAQQLYVARKIQLASEVRPTPVESPEDAVKRLSDLEPMGDGKFLIRAPWLADGAEVIEGDEDTARARLAEIQDAGLEKYGEAVKVASGSTSDANAADIGGQVLTGGDGFVVEETGSNGYFTVSAPGREPEKVRGRAAADARLIELRAEAANASDGSGDAVVDEEG